MEWVWWMIAAGVLGGRARSSRLGFFGPIAVAAVAGRGRGAAGGGVAGPVDRVQSCSVGALAVLRPIAQRHLNTPRGSADRHGRAGRAPRRPCSSGWTRRRPREDRRRDLERPLLRRGRAFEPGDRVEVMKIDGATALVANERKDAHGHRRSSLAVVAAAWCSSSSLRGDPDRAAGARRHRRAAGPLLPDARRRAWRWWCRSSTGCGR